MSDSRTVIGRAAGLTTFLVLGCGGPPKEAPEPSGKPHAPASHFPRALFGVQWNLVELGDTEAEPGQGGKPATLELTEPGTRVSGFAGCNRLAGTYDLRGDSLRLGPLVLTRMACQNGMELERAYVEALEATRTYSVSPTNLELRGESGPVALFEAQ
ncbi:MAG: META domain-containing protein [Gemmatimonadales bacterium]